MPKLYINKSRPLFLFFIVGCCLIILMASHFPFPPLGKTDDLDVLILNKEADPTFYLTSQLSYTPELIHTLSHSSSQQTAYISNANTTIPSQMLPAQQPEDASYTNTLEEAVHSESEPSPLDRSTTIAEPSPLGLSSTVSVGSTRMSASTYSNINLLIDLETTILDTNSLIKDLNILNGTLNIISLSILPASHMTNEAYLTQCQLINNALITHKLSNIYLIIYPRDTTNLSLYNQDFITCIGTVLQEHGNLEQLDAIYNYFAFKKTLFVRDDIKNFHPTDHTKAVKEINAIYYTLAIKYPEIDTIFSPCIQSNISYEDSYSLNSQDESFYLFYTIYNRLLEKNWITTTKAPLSNASPYIPLQSYDSLKGEIEIVLAPDSNILSSLAMIRDPAINNHYISFKWNTSVLPITANYPYLITLDTTKEPNGVSRLKAILQDSNNTIIESYSIDLIVDNPLSTLRPSRIKSPVLPSATYTKNIDNYIPILMYHTVEDTVLPESQNSCVETKNFEAQMKSLLDNGYTPINFFDLKAYLNGTATLPSHPIIITMDDGYLNNYTKAYPIYKKYNIQATLFVSPYYMVDKSTTRHFGWDAAKEMEESGLIDIQPHGYDHTPFPYLSLKDLKYHITLSKGIIEHHLGPRDVSVVSCPQFRNTLHTRKSLSALGIDFQITDLAKLGTVLTPTSLKRINVPNTMTPNELIATLDALTH